MGGNTPTSGTCKAHGEPAFDISGSDYAALYGICLWNQPDSSSLQKKMQVLQSLGVPYTAEEIAAAPQALREQLREDLADRNEREKRELVTARSLLLSLTRNKRTRP